MAAALLVSASLPAWAQAPQPGASSRSGDHPAVAVQRLSRQAGYDWAAHIYPHPAWLYLRATEQSDALSTGHERPSMNSTPDDTESVVRRHLLAFVEQKGTDAILRDYADDACFLSDGRSHCGKAAIRGFLDAFIGALPPSAVAQFRLHTLRVQGEVAHITWSAGPALPLGTDTFVVRNGRIVAQTFVML